MKFILIIFLFLILLLILASIQDLINRKISNIISYTNILLASLYRLHKGLNYFTIKLFLALFIGIIFLFLYGSIGGGDLKNFVAVALIDPQIGFIAVIFSLVLTSIIIKKIKKPPILTICITTFIILYVLLN